jgi:hypothetical protein
VISDFHHGLIDYGSGNNAYLTDGYDPTSTATTPNNGVTPGTTFDQGFPLGQLQTKNLTPSYGIGSTFDYWSRYANTVANVQSWNLSVQTQLAPNLALDVAYVGTKGTHLTSAENINQLNDAYLGLGATLLSSNINSPAVVAAGFTAPCAGFASALGANATLAQALRPYPQYLTGFGYNSDNDGNSSYQALQAKIEKRLSNGLYLLASYTWDKSITDANTTLLSTPGNNPGGRGRARDQNNRHLDKSVASDWQPMVFTTAFSYELPIAPGKMLLNRGGIAGRLIGGMASQWHSYLPHRRPDQRRGPAEPAQLRWPELRDNRSRRSTERNLERTVQSGRESLSQPQRLRRPGRLWNRRRLSAEPARPGLSG